MNLYLLTQNVNNNYDTYDSIVVASETEDSAKRISPSGEEVREDLVTHGAWAPLDSIKVTYLGIAKENTEAGVILTSFNAG